MSELQSLKALVGQLEESTNQVETLQAIGKELLTKYVIQLPGNIRIQPLWVEAYYSNAGKKFADPFIHGVDEQKGDENFGKLYFHHKTDDQRSGVDICLPCGAYHLSFLLKYTLVNDEFTTQGQLSRKIREAYNQLSEEKKAEILHREENSTEYIMYTTRIGLGTRNEEDKERKEYQKLPLAIVRDFHKKFVASTSLPGKEKLIKQYLDSSNKTVSEKAAFCRKHLGYCPSEYKEK